MFFDRFEELCRLRGVTPTKAAQEAGINKSTVTYWRKNAESKPTGQVAERLCAYFGITMSELYGDGPNPPQEDSVPEHTGGATDEEIRFALFGGTEGITDAMYDEVKQFARFVKERERNKK